jgi:ribosome-associated translation inhibitor RaiA
MKIEFHAHGQPLTPGLREHAESSLRRAMRRFAGRVRKVKVYLWDANGPRGGVDKGVRLIVELSRAGEVLVRATDSSPFAALAGAASRARRSVGKELRRRWDRARRGTRRARPARNAAAALSAGA